MIKRMQNCLYGFLIQGATTHCYQNCLHYFPSGSMVLDVGIGNGAMLHDFHALIREKNLKIDGIDINRHYLSQCEDLIRKYHMQNHIRIFHEAVERLHPPGGSRYDFIFFSLSFMLFGNQQAVLDRVRNWLRPRGRLVFFQTMFKSRSAFLDYIKPRLVYVTTVDFGSVVYEDRFQDFLKRNRLTILLDQMIKREWHRGEYRMIVALPGRSEQR